MAEVRKHNPDEADGLAKLVRDALGERLRPHEPGRTPTPAKDEGKEGLDATSPSSASTMPSWSSEGQSFTF